MISDEVRMLGNRMRSNPEEFYAGTVEFGNRPIASESRKWDSLMNSLVNDKPDMDILFTPEEIKYLRDTLKEVLRPMALATIVKTIVGGEDVAQMEMDLTDSTVYKKRALITQAELIKLKATGQI
jgi:hypothetical protein